LEPKATTDIDMDAALHKTIDEALAPIQATLKRIEHRITAIEANTGDAEYPSRMETWRTTPSAPSVLSHTEETVEEDPFSLALQQITSMRETDRIQDCPHW
jgi:hypothetical protein